MPANTEVPTTADEPKIVSARPLHVPEVDPYTGAPVEMGAAVASARFDEAVRESREALRQQIHALVFAYVQPGGPHSRDMLSLAVDELLGSRGEID